MDNVYKRVSLVDRVFEKIEDDILFGRYPRGEVLTEMRLAEELGVSRTPIHDALLRLAEERLIEDNGRGFTVLGITREDVEDIMEIRHNVEGLASYYTTLNRTQETLDELLHIVELQEFYTAKGDRDRTKEMDDQFHSAICRLCKHNVISDTLIPLHKKIQRYRRASIADEARMKRMAEEHRSIYEAIAAGDAEQAKKLTQLHVENARKNMMKEKVD